MAINFSSIVCKQAFFRLKIDYSCDFNYDCVSKCNSDYDYFMTIFFQDDKKEYKSLIYTFPLKNRRFFIILPTKFIGLNCTAS